MQPLTIYPASDGGSAGRSRPVGQTSRTTERPPQWLAKPALHFDLDHELAQLRGEERWQHGGHNAKALVKEASLRLVLVAIKQGAILPAHRAPAPITIQTLRGHLWVHLTDQAVDLPIGSLLALDGNVEHEVEAVEESAFLLTLTWANAPSEAEATLASTSDQTTPRLDVRQITPRERHELIFATFAALQPGQAFELVNDHDPKPLYYQFQAEHPGTFTWDYAEQGPTTWQVRIGKVDA